MALPTPLPPQNTPAVGLDRTPSLAFWQYWISLDAWIRGNIRSTIVSDFTVTSSIALTNVPGLLATVKSGRTYIFEAVLFIKSGATHGGMQAAIAGDTVTAADIRYDGYCLDTGGTPIHGYVQESSLGAAVGLANTASDTSTLYIHGTITVNAGGHLTVQVAQNSSNATPTVFARGSYFVVRDAT